MTRACRGRRALPGLKVTKACRGRRALPGLKVTRACRGRRALPGPLDLRATMACRARRVLRVNQANGASKSLPASKEAKVPKVRRGPLG